MILGIAVDWGCRCATSLCDFELTFELAVVILTLKCFLGYFSETVKHRKLIRGRDSKGV